MSLILNARTTIQNDAKSSTLNINWLVCVNEFNVKSEPNEEERWRIG